MLFLLGFVTMIFTYILFKFLEWKFSKQKSVQVIHWIIFKVTNSQQWFSSFLSYFKCNILLQIYIDQFIAQFEVKYSIYEIVSYILNPYECIYLLMYAFTLTSSQRKRPFIQYVPFDFKKKCLTNNWALKRKHSKIVQNATK